MMSRKEREMSMELNISPCPYCEGKVRMYSTADPERKGYNCFAKCTKCNQEFPMPEAWLKTYKAIHIWPQSIKKAVRLWNKKAEALRGEKNE